ncbi:hypothetical protein TNCV_1409501 [Trichonephila clavipes]|uniref:Uncharacterized protein n=1 Tax=Trichonephila clavipes TaxID=2585209 RepID=A0A8X6R1N6_TRICX|nr:hypothetical protein TNCV_1409501 [Trichonephila clavipes]
MQMGYLPLPRVICASSKEDEPTSDRGPPFLCRLIRTRITLPFWLMPLVRRSQNEAHEMHRSKGLEVRLSLA